MAFETTKIKRPSNIALISILMICQGLIFFFCMARAGFQYLGIFAIQVAVLGILFLACGIGFWMMRKWAVYQYAILAVVGQIVLLLAGARNIYSLVVLLIIFVGDKNLSNMS